jgi:hypothetical protein
LSPRGCRFFFPNTSVHFSLNAGAARAVARERRAADSGATSRLNKGLEFMMNLMSCEGIESTGERAFIGTRANQMVKILTQFHPKWPLRFTPTRWLGNFSFVVPVIFTCQFIFHAGACPVQPRTARGIADPTCGMV